MKHIARHPERDAAERPAAKAGFTIIEILIAVAVLAVLVAAVIPSFTPDDRQRLNAAAMLLASDIEYAKVATLARPGNPLIVRFADDGTGYWIAEADSPNAPVTRADTDEPYAVTFGAGRASGINDIKATPANMTSRSLVFDAHGGLDDFTLTPTVSLTIGETNHPRVVITIAPTTGTTTVVYEP